MNAFRYSAFLHEFPFLADVFRRTDGSTQARDPLNCDSITIKRVDEHVLNLAPEYYGATGSLVDIAQGEKVTFIRTDGPPLLDAVKTTGHVDHNEAYQDSESWDGESILEAIDRLGNLYSSLTHIVVIKYGYETRNHASLPNWSATIYKAAKGSSILEHLQQAHLQALKVVQAEAAF